jgi:hypothetical protein
VRPANLRQVEYLAAMKDDHLLCMQVFCGASEADQPAASGIPGCHGRRSLRILDRAWSQQVQAQIQKFLISLLSLERRSIRNLNLFYISNILMGKCRKNRKNILGKRKQTF